MPGTRDTKVGPTAQHLKCTETTVSGAAPAERDKEAEGRMGGWEVRMRSVEQLNLAGPDHKLSILPGRGSRVLIPEECKR